MYTLGLSCMWTCLHCLTTEAFAYKGLNCTWMCPDNRSLCCFWTYLLYREMSSLHLNEPRRQKPVMLLNLAKLQGPEPHLDGSLVNRSLSCTRICLPCNFNFLALSATSLTNFKRWATSLKNVKHCRRPQ
jgi:hypothetical protein